MKNLLFLLLIFLFACENKKTDTFGNVTIYTLDKSNWSLIIDGKEYGKIRNATQMPVCGDPIFQNIKLTTGNHTFDAKSLDGYAWGNPKTYNIKEGCQQIRLP